MEDPITKLVVRCPLQTTRPVRCSCSRQNEFSSLIDEALILSMCSDYDLNNPEGFQQARQALLIVSENVPFEEASGFNASGLEQRIVDIHDAATDGSGEPRSVAAESDLRSNDGLTTTTESSIPQSILSTASSKPSTQDAQETLRFSIFDGLGGEEKEKRLQEIFPELKPIDITLALQKFDGDADRAVEVLLTTSHLEQTGQRPKGIDGFYVDDDAVPTRRKRGKKKKAIVRSTESTNPSSANSSDESNVLDEKHRGNISYLAERLPVGESEIEEIYVQKRKSMGAAVVQILDNYIAAGIDPLGSERCPAADEQVKKYPWVPATYMAPIFGLTSSRQQAMDLIQILAAYYEKPVYLRYDVSYNISAPRLDIDTIGSNPSKPWSVVAGKAPAAPRRNAPSSSATPTTLRSGDLAELRNHSFQAAGAAYKKGGLYRSAAAVLSERGRDLSRDLHQARSSEAAQYVNQRSKPDEIDLHGVTVQDGVGIALDRVWSWWESLGEEKARKARDGFTIVTGLGRHSAGGISPLRINVFKALVADGWKVTVLTGQYLVTGRK
ncbi:smr domain-containing protein [Seiridium cupressi]